MKIIRNENPELNNFDIRMEKIEKQIEVIHPARGVWPIAQKNKIITELSAGNRSLLENNGVVSFLNTPEKANMLGEILAMLNYSKNNYLWSDLGAGLYTLITRPGSDLYSMRHLKDDTGKTVSTEMIISDKGILKLLLGPLIKNNGRAVSGATKIVKEIKKKLSPILSMDSIEPIAFYTKNLKLSNGKNHNVLFKLKPIIINEVIKGVVRLTIDHKAFPLKKNATIAGDVYIPQVAGLNSVVSFGRYLLKGTRDLPQTNCIHRLIVYCQAVKHLTRIAPGILKKIDSSPNQFDLMLRRHVIKDIFPSAVNSSGYIDYKKVSKLVSIGGDIFRAALIETGIMTKLSGDILIPATHNSAYFPPENKQIVFIRADRTTKHGEKRIEKIDVQLPEVKGQGSLFFD